MPDRVHQIPAPIDRDEALGLSPVPGSRVAMPIAEPQHVEQELGDQGHHHAGQHRTPGDLVEQDGALVLGRRGRAQVRRVAVAAVARRVGLVGGIRGGGHNVSISTRVRFKGRKKSMVPRMFKHQVKV